MKAVVALLIVSLLSQTATACPFRIFRPRYSPPARPTQLPQARPSPPLAIRPRLRGVEVGEGYISLLLESGRVVIHTPQRSTSRLDALIAWCEQHDCELRLTRTCIAIIPPNGQRFRLTERGRDCVQSYTDASDELRFVDGGEDRNGTLDYALGCIKTDWHLEAIDVQEDSAEEEDQ